MEPVSEKARLLEPDAADGRSQLIRLHRRERSHRPILRSALAILAVVGLTWRMSLFWSGDEGHATPIDEAGKGKSSVCMTPACVHAASELLYNLSPNYKNIDACTDFEELVCGGWRDRHDLRADQGDAFTGTFMAENAQMLLRHILEAPYPKDSAHSYFSPMQLGTAKKSVDEMNFDKMKDAYNACLDENTVKERGTGPLMEVINHVKELYPLASDGTGAQDERLQSSILHLHQLGISAIFSPWTGADDKDPDTVVVSIAPLRRIGLPAKELYEDEKIVAKYSAVISEVFASLMPAASSQDVGSELVEFEKKLAAAAPDAEDADDVTKYYNPMSLEATSDMLPQAGIASIVGKLSAGVPVTKVINMSPSYLNQTSTILSETADPVIQSYLIWKAVQSLQSYIIADALTPYKRLMNELQGKDPDASSERWRTCLSHVDDGLGWILSRFYVEKAFSAKAKKVGDQMVSDIRDQYINKLKATKWMEKRVSELAIQKARNIIQKIGYPTESPDIMDPTALQKYYETVPVDNNTFFANALAMNHMEIASMWSDLGKPVDRARFDMHSTTVNAYYNPPGNEIVFPAAILQPPVFDVDVPQYLSYGAFASVAGHEMGHSFDSTGRHYDQNGNYTDWWTNSTVKEFTKRADCFVSQYSNFSVVGPDGNEVHVNGKLTLGENIADAGGVAAAFAAWKSRENESPELNLELPGLNDKFTKDQLFFVNYANWWCGTTRPGTAIQRVYTDPHAPKKARILGTMANSRDFLKAFKCKQKEPVCELW